MYEPLDPPTLRPVDTNTRTLEQKKGTARREAFPVIGAGVLLTFVAHPILLFGPDLGLMAGTIVAILGMLGPVLVFLGFMALHTYYENVDEARYFRDDSVGIGSAMARRDQH